jgi:uncharacterized protein YjbI with pentapeptide repeats
MLSLYFQNCHLKLSVFSKLALKKTTFNNCNVQETDFSETDLREAVFNNCDFQGAIFRHTNLEKADLQSSYSYSIDPENNRLRKARFSRQGIIGLLDKYGIIVD